jgi:hypothetical protein
LTANYRRLLEQIGYSAAEMQARLAGLGLPDDSAG